VLASAPDTEANQAESRTDSISVTEESKSTYAIAGHSSLWYLSFDRRGMIILIFFYTLLFLNARAFDRSAE